MHQAKETLQESIAQQRRELLEIMQEPLQQLAARCHPVWADRAKLDRVLSEGSENAALRQIALCVGYQCDPDQQQCQCRRFDAGINRPGSLKTALHERSLADHGHLLSEAYISLLGRRPSLTAVQIVRDLSGAVLGFIGTDFDLRDLPLTHKLYDEPVFWRQLKGDPSIRDTVFHQNRAESAMDRQIDTVLGVIEELMVYHGVYHVMLHFSSNRAVIWEMGDPYRYRLLDIDALIDPDICLAYPRTPYPTDALVPRERIRAVLDLFRQAAIHGRDVLPALGHVESL